VALVPSTLLRMTIGVRPAREEARP
jgi:hypothetical protein